MASEKKEIYTYVKTCADCGGKNIRASHTYTLANGIIRRYRECVDCGYKFSTVEIEESVSDITGLLDDVCGLRKRVVELESINNCLTKQRDELLSIHVKGTDELSSQLSDEDLTKNFVANCRYLCAKKGMLIRDLEGALGLTTGYLKKSADLNKNIGLRFVYKASVVLGVPINRLLSPRECVI